MSSLELAAVVLCALLLGYLAGRWLGSRRVTVTAINLSKKEARRVARELLAASEQYDCLGCGDDCVSAAGYPCDCEERWRAQHGEKEEPGCGVCGACESGQPKLCFGVH